jgi:hypothetical protein
MHGSFVNKHKGGNHDHYLPLHTFNRKHYEIIPDLITIQPYRK